MMQQIVYLKIPLRVIVKNQSITVKDIATIYCKDSLLKDKVDKIEVIHVEGNKKQQYAVSVMKIIELITEVDERLTVVNLGEEEFLIDYMPSNYVNKFLEYSKTLFVAFIIFFGAAFSIMTFDTDVSVSTVFNNVYHLVMGTSGKGQGIVELAYCLGLPIGIFVFFNHFSMRKVRKDPTPIQIEMRKYEKDIEGALLSNASREGKMIDVD